MRGLVALISASIILPISVSDVVSNSFDMIPEFNLALAEEAIPTELNRGQQPISDYESIKKEIEAKRQDFGERYQKATEEGKEDIVREARLFLYDSLVNKIFPAWYGTKWDYNGTTEEPGEGNIACGYFVTTTLRDAGFDLNRVKLAQQASEKMIKNLTAGGNIRRYSNKTTEDVEQDMESRPPGLYVVGLDYHCGFIAYDGKGIRFINSAFKPKLQVVSESLSENPCFDQSKYRVIGRILHDGMVEKWIKGENIPMTYK